MIRYPKASLTSLCIFTACHSASVPAPEPSPSPAISVTEVPTETRSIHRWLIPLATGTHTYASTSQTIIQEGHDHISRRDTIQVSIWFRISGNERSDSIVLIGSIDSIHSKTSLPPTQLPVPFTVSIKSGQIRFQSQNSNSPNSPCSNSITEPIGDIVTILLTRPMEISTTSTWTDSSTTTVCSRGFPILSQRVRSYRVIGQETQSGAESLKLHRFETSTFSGSGAQNQHQITITGEGQTTSQISIDIRSGIPTNAITKETASISITGSGQTNQFIQQVDQRITLIR